MRRCYSEGRLLEYDCPEPSSSLRHTRQYAGSSSSSSWSVLSAGDDFVRLPEKIDRRSLDGVETGTLALLDVVIESKSRFIIREYDWRHRTGEKPEPNPDAARRTWNVMRSDAREDWIVTVDNPNKSTVVTEREIHEKAALVYNTPSEVAAKDGGSFSDAESWNSLSFALFGELGQQPNPPTDIVTFSMAVACVIKASDQLLDNASGGPLLACEWKVDRSVGSVLVLEFPTDGLVYVDVFDLSRQVILGPFFTDSMRSLPGCLLLDKDDPLRRVENLDVTTCAETKKIDAIPYKDFMKMKEWIPPNCKRARTTWREWRKIIFISHPWLREDHPDPDGKLLKELHETLPLFVEQFARHCIGEESSFDQWNRRNDGVTDYSVFAGMSFSDAMDFLQTNIGVWLDYLVVPNDNAHAECTTCKQRKRQMISNIDYLTQISFVLYVGEDKDLERGWIVTELVNGKRNNVSIMRGGQVQRFDKYPSIVPLLTGQAYFTNGGDYTLVLAQFLENFALGPRCWAHINMGYCQKYDEEGAEIAFRWVCAMVYDGRQLDPDGKDVGLLTEDDIMKSRVRAHLKICFRRAAYGETASLLKGLQLLHQYELPGIRASLARRADLSDEERLLISQHWHSARLQLFSCSVRGLRCFHEGQSLGTKFWRELARLYQTVLGHCGIWREQPDGAPPIYVPQAMIENSRWYRVIGEDCTCGCKTAKCIVMTDPE